MKIAFFNQPIGTISLPAQGDSTAIWTYEVARRLAQYSDVIVYSLRGRRQKKVEYDQGVYYRRISTFSDTLVAYVLSAVDKRFPRSLNVKLPFFALVSYYLMYALQAAKDLRKEKCDIVHLQNFSQFVPIIRAFNPKIKIVLHMHCEWLTQLDQTMIEPRLREVDLVIGCSEHITEKTAAASRGLPNVARPFSMVLTSITTLARTMTV